MKEGETVKPYFVCVLLVLLICSLATGPVSAQIIGGVTPPETITIEPTLLPTEPTTVPPTEPTITITVPTEIPAPIGGGKGWIDTYCNIDGATVYFDGVPQGTIAGGLLSVGVSPSGTPVRTVSVSKAGYTSSSTALSHMPADQEHVAVYATINPVPTQPTVPPIQSGSIYAQSSPAGAAIYVNGNYYGYAPITIPNLAPGTFSIRATLAGYTPDTGSITVYAGQTSPYYPVLQQSPPPPRQTGSVLVTSTPDHALVYVDGNYQGKAPLTAVLYPGSHIFRFSLAGYSDYSSTVYVSGGQSQSLNGILGTAIVGTVAVTAMPGANVFIDSSPQGAIPSSGVLSINDISSGNRLFRVSAPGFNDWINTVYVVPNTVTSVSAVLTPSGSGPSPTSPPATGGFNIVSTPAGAEIYVDNLFRGYTPAVLDGIPAGDHAVMLRYTGYIDYSTSSAVNPGQTTPLAISMQPAPTPTPASPLLPVSTVGGLAVLAALGSMKRRRS